MIFKWCFLCRKAVCVDKINKVIICVFVKYKKICAQWQYSFIFLKIVGGVCFRMVLDTELVYIDFAL